MACLADRAPCFPSRTCSISSRTNALACVLGDFPSRLAFRARSKVFFSGMVPPRPWRELSLTMNACGLPRVGGRALYRHDDLARLIGGCKAPVRSGHIGKRVLAVDDRPQ